MKTTTLAIGLVVSMNCSLAAATKVWTDPEKAASENPDFLVQGEYSGKGKGIQVVATGKGNFLISEYFGGLPGAGWDGSEIKQSTGSTNEVEAKVAKLKRNTRKLSSLGKNAPKGAVVLFDESPATKWQKEWKGGRLVDGFLAEGPTTVQEFGDFTMHLEFRLPFKPETALSHQDRGNSGIYIFGRYECQIIDSFGLDYTNESAVVKRQSDPKQWCGSLYKFKAPDVPMCLPPLEWQSYDIDFTAPRFKDGKKTRNAKITAWLNGVKIHDNVDLPKGTGNGGKKAEVARGPILLQGHGNPLRFRNVWLLEK